MWTAWVIFYISLWITGSGFVFGGPNKFTNVAAGFFLAFFSAWVGIVYRRSLLLDPPGSDKNK